MSSIEMEIAVLVLEHRLNNSISLESSYQSELDNLNSGMISLENNESLTVEESQAVLSELSYIGTSESLDNDNDTFYNIDFYSVAERDLYEQRGFTANLREAHSRALENLGSTKARDGLRDEVFTILEDSNSANSVYEEVRYVLCQLESEFQ